MIFSVLLFPLAIKILPCSVNLQSPPQVKFIHSVEIEEIFSFHIHLNQSVRSFWGSTQIIAEWIDPIVVSNIPAIFDLELCSPTFWYLFPYYVTHFESTQLHIQTPVLFIKIICHFSQNLVVIPPFHTPLLLTKLLCQEYYHLNFSYNMIDLDFIIYL